MAEHHSGLDEKFKLLRLLISGFLFSGGGFFRCGGGGDSSVCADAELAELPASSSHFLIAMLSSTLTYACCKSGSIRDLFD